MDNINMTKDDLDKTIKKIYSFSKLKKDWNGYGAEPIPSRVFSDVVIFFKDIKFPFKPVPFDGGIQIEYEIDDDNYIEIEFSHNLFYDALICIDGKEREFSFNRTIVNKVVSDFLDKTNLRKYIYVVKHTSCIYESSPDVISAHKSKINAYKEYKKIYVEKFNEWRYNDGYGKPKYKFLKDERLFIDLIELKD